MIKNINKKVTKIILLVVILLAVISINNHCFALGDVTEWTHWEPTIESDTSLSEKVEPILGAIRVIGILISVGSLSFIGIKIMVGSVEDKSNYKQVLVPWVLGATMVFAMTFIPSIVYDIISETVSQPSVQSGEYKSGNEAFLAGYDDGIYEAKGILEEYKGIYGNYDGCENKLNEAQLGAHGGYESDPNGYQGGRYRALNSIWNNVKNNGYDPEQLVKGNIDAAVAIKERSIYAYGQSDVEINVDTIKNIYKDYQRQAESGSSWAKGVANRLYWQGLLWGVNCNEN